MRFSPSGTSFAVATTDGLVIFSQDASLSYVPFELSEDVTPDAVRGAIRDRSFTTALVVRLTLPSPWTPRFSSSFFHPSLCFLFTLIRFTFSHFYSLLSCSLLFFMSIPFLLLALHLECSSSFCRDLCYPFPFHLLV